MGGRKEGITVFLFGKPQAGDRPKQLFARGAAGLGERWGVGLRGVFASSLG